MARPCLPGCEAEEELPERAPVVETIRALASATAGGRPLPAPAYTFLFPVLRAVLSWPQHTALHEEALAAVALHVAPGGALPRAALLTLLYRVLDLMPAYRRATRAMHQRLSLHRAVFQDAALAHEHHTQFPLLCSGPRCSRCW